MTRRDIIVQILSEAAGRPVDQVADLFESMLEEDMISPRGLDDEVPAGAAEHLLQEFREELPGIRRWLVEAGLLDEFGQA